MNEVIVMNQGTNGGEAYKQKCHQYWQSVRFYVELAHTMEGTFSGAARELNRKRVPTMHGAKWHPQTVKSALEHYTNIDSQKDAA
ncbi:hypothetical protein PL84_03595 [Vibrio anguillarum]|uniref:hypothetical protein n=1 Tax=Vibrio anguillarum TaxID=55601 RepID=UPI00097E2910|nr:hypothetical protein [Vibrio anguillarum]MBT2909665.1 hypothetical protein [Vibrio anguillarum]MBT2942484.1 hypothetical protein [Vibrio anguillarum]MBT2950692.1 hypothetical protein [Vibrio anguillarum]MBT2979530.1 hypothetical protein [Vibrio anguillarum]